MNIVAWVLFGIINGLVLNVFDRKKDKTKPMHAMTLGGLGALSGGVLAYSIFGGNTSGLNATLFLVLFFEAILLFYLFTQKTFRRI